MWSYGFDLRSSWLIVIKMVVSSEGTCDDCLSVEVFDYFLKRFLFLQATRDF